MEDVVITGSWDENRLFNQVLSRYDVPAYLRRAQQVEAAWRTLAERLERERQELLRGVGYTLSWLGSLAGTWEHLHPAVANADQVQWLRELEASLPPGRRMPASPTRSLRPLRRAFEDLRASVRRFNRRWQAFLAAVDLQPINAVREGYNRYYLIEKECAVRSPRLARLGYQPLPLLDVQQLLDAFPLLREL